MTDLSNHAWRVGRKDHRCEGCRALIKRGEPYFHFWGRWEGEWQDWRLHAECHEIWKESDDEELRDYPVPERLRA